MRQKQRRRVFVHVFRLHAQIEVCDFRRQFVLFLPVPFRNQRHIRARQRRIADEFELLLRQRGHKADRPRAVGVEVAAEAAGDVHGTEVAEVHADLAEHHAAGREDRSLGADDVADVVLGDVDVAARGAFLRSGQDVPGLPAGGLDRLARPAAVQLARGVQPAGFEEVRQQRDHAGAADAGRLSPADDGTGRQAGRLVHFRPFHGALARAHAAVQPAALEGRAGRARAAHQELAVAQHQLAVRADVDEQADFV